MNRGLASLPSAATRAVGPGDASPLTPKMTSAQGGRGAGDLVAPGDQMAVRKRAP